jgi:hypothetical protein
MKSNGTRSRIFGPLSTFELALFDDDHQLRPHDGVKFRLQSWASLQ